VTVGATKAAKTLQRRGVLYKVIAAVGASSTARRSWDGEVVKNGAYGYWVQSGEKSGWA
jgi:hypothetical protein